MSDAIPSRDIAASPKRRSAKKILLTSAGILLAVIACGYFINRDMRNPFDDVIFEMDYPGATERHVSFTPCSVASPGIPIGPTVGADYGKLSFYDTDGDGVYEAIVESNRPFYRSEWYSKSRHVYKMNRDRDGNPHVILISSDYEDAPDASP